LLSAVAVKTALYRRDRKTLVERFFEWQPEFGLENVLISRYSVAQIRTDDPHFCDSNFKVEFFFFVVYLDGLISLAYSHSELLTKI
jgi:hypothetical protein